MSESSAAFIDRLRREFPGFRLVYKDQSRLSWLLDRLLKLLTFGGQSSYLTRYHTVLGHTLYVPRLWDETPELDRAILLRHERVHLQQRRRLGLPLMAFLYLVPFFPLGLAYGRARLEWEACQETVRATAELRGIEAACSEALRERIVGRFLAGSYGWMWPFRNQVEAWYSQLIAELERAEDLGDDPSDDPPSARTT